MKDFEPRRLGAVARATVLSLVAVLPGCQFINIPEPTNNIAIPSEISSNPSQTAEYLKRLNSLRSVPGNEQAIVWPNSLNADSITKSSQDKESIKKNRDTIDRGIDFIVRVSVENPSASMEDVKGIMKSSNIPLDLTVDFDKEPRPTYRFINGTLRSEDKHFPTVFLDSSGRFKNYQGLTDIIDSVPQFDSHQTLYLPENVIMIPKDVIPEGGFVMVFTKPGVAPEEHEPANAKYDIWELDTAVYTESARLHSIKNKISKEVTFIVHGTQDRTDRLTPFYRKEPSFVERVVVIFDNKGKAIGKIGDLQNEFKPREPWMDTYQGNPALVNPDYKPPKGGEIMDVTTFLKRKWEYVEMFNGKDLTLNVDQTGIILSVSGYPPEQFDPNYIPIYFAQKNLSGNNPEYINGFAFDVTREQYDKFVQDGWGMKNKQSYYGRAAVELLPGAKIHLRVDKNGTLRFQGIS